MDEFKVITGTAKEVEKELNKYNKAYIVAVVAITATNEQTTVIAQLMGNR
jgi:hypothetical protein